MLLTEALSYVASKALGGWEGSFEVFRGLLGASWGSLGGLLGVFWEVLGGSEAHFGAYTFKRGGWYFGVVVFF